MCLPMLAGLFGGAGAAGAAGMSAAAAAGTAAVGGMAAAAAPAAAMWAGLGSGAAAGAAGAGFGSLGTALQMGGALVSALGQMANANAMAAAAEASARSAERIALENMESGEEESDLVMRRKAQLIGQNKVAMAANGMDVGGPQAIEQLEDTNAMADQDAFRIRKNAWRQATAMGERAANYEAEAATHRSAAMWQPISTLLGAGARVFDRWGQYQAGMRYTPASAGITPGGY